VPAASGQLGRARASWGWHRLADDWAARVVAAADVRPGELVLDIGAGQGALTRPLIKAGVRVIAVELHPGRAEALRRRFGTVSGGTVSGGTVSGGTVSGGTVSGGTVSGGRNDDSASGNGRASSVSGVTVVQADAASLRLPRQPFRVVASPPYGITADLLSLLLGPGSRLVAADLVLQRAAARKYAERRVRGCRITQGLAVPRRAFTPPPRVDSAVLVIRRQPR
jgi:23S rRNA (adenine-N6)-dimethyltransferase